MNSVRNSGRSQPQKETRSDRCIIARLNPNYASWASSGTHLYFSSYTQRKLYRVAVTGGQPAPVEIAGSVGGHIAVTPDDKSVLLVQRFNIFEAPLTGGPRTLVSDQGGFPLRPAPGGDFVYYVRNRFSNEIWKVRRSTSEVTLISDRLWPGCWGCWDVSKNGVLVYVTGLSTGLPQLERLDLNIGNRTVLGMLPYRQATMNHGMLAVSPDGKQLLADIVEPGNGDIHWSDSSY